MHISRNIWFFEIYKIISQLYKIPNYSYVSGQDCPLTIDTNVSKFYNVNLATEMSNIMSPSC
jgi:hypothetical protein